MKNFLHLSNDQIERLRPLCHLIWWQSEDETLKWPERLIAQVMDRGLFYEWDLLMSVVTKEQMGEVLKNALPGWFKPQAWTYWHLMCLNIRYPNVPPLPVRRFV